MSERPVDVILSRLANVRETGPDQWLACCPAHEDRSPSLSIRDGDDGRVLIHCFAGCSAPEIMHALALDLDDLFPGRDRKRRLNPRRWQQQGPPMRPMDVLRVAQHELTIVSVGAGIAAKNQLNPEECERLCIASTRIREAVSYAIER